MPAAAVIPAPQAYINVVAVKKLVVGYLSWRTWPNIADALLCAGFRLVVVVALGLRIGLCSALACSSDILQENCSAINLVGARILIVYFEKIRVFNAGFIVANRLAWNNKIGLRHRWLSATCLHEPDCWSSILLVSRAEVMIDRDSWGCSYCGARGEILGFS